MKSPLSGPTVALLAVLVLCSFLAGPAPAADAPERKPKYVFLFIGDGMGLPQISAASTTSPPRRARWAETIWS